MGWMPEVISVMGGGTGYMSKAETGVTGDKVSQIHNMKRNCTI